MQRFAAVWQASPRKLTGVLFLLLLTAGAAVGSGANFTAQSASPGNMVTAGALSIDNNRKTAAAIFSASNIKPGDDVIGTVTVSNTGTLSGDFTLGVANIVNTPSAAPLLSDNLNLKVEDLTAAPVATIYNGALNAYGAAPRALFTNWLAGASRNYRVTVHWTPGASDNALQSAQVKMDFDWAAVQN